MLRSKWGMAILYLIPILFQIISPDTEVWELSAKLVWVMALVPPVIVPILYGVRGILFVTCAFTITSISATVIDYYGTEIPLLDYFFTTGFTLVTLGISISISIHYLNKKITLKQSELEESRESYKSLIKLSPDIICVFDEREIRLMNDAGLRFLNLSSEQVIGKPIWAFAHEEFKEQIKSGVENSFANSAILINEEISFRKPDGEQVDIEVTSSPVTFKGLSARLAIIRDITERKEQEKQISFLAYHDPLTGLVNRTFFTDFVKENITYSPRDAFAILFIDLDRFKYVNDTFGHDIGDLLIKQAATRITSSVRNEDLVGRLGGDEFVIFLNKASREAAKLMCERIIKSLNFPFMLAGQQIYITSSIGISTYPDNGTDINTLLKGADSAMYKAKEKGKNTYQFSERNQGSYSGAFMLEMELRKAVERQGFELYYQPKVNPQSNRIVAAEALIRWKHEGLGFISPSIFIPLAEDIGLMNQIGEWVLRKACEENKRWQEAGNKQIIVCVNLSVQQLYQDNFLTIVQKVLNETKLEPKYLNLEITESLIMENINWCIPILMELKKLGIKLSLDDFGTGYSSLASFKLLPIDFLKIDKLFIRDVRCGSQDDDLVRTIISISHSLGITVVAEGVENQEQLQRLQEYNCDEVQGSYFSMPIPPRKFEELLNAE